MTQRQVHLSPDQRAELLQLRDHHVKPYVRERAAAIIKVADGMPAAHVARDGLLRPRRPDTLYAWLDRFEQEGVDGLRLRAGRGRKPAFSPSRPPQSRS